MKIHFLIIFFLLINFYSYAVNYDRFFFKSIIEGDENTAINLLKKEKVSIYITLIINIPGYKSLNKKTSSKVNILELASVYNRADIIHYLLSVDIEKQVDRNTELNYIELAFLHGNYEVCKYLLDNKKFSKKNLLLHKYATISKNQKVIDLLKEKKKIIVSKQKKDNNLKGYRNKIHFLSKKIRKSKQLESKKVFLDFIDSLRNNKLDEAKRLLEKYSLDNQSFKIDMVYTTISLTQQKSTIKKKIETNSFLVSVYFNNYEMVEYHFNKNSQVNKLDGFNSNAVHYAATLNNLDMLKLLIKNGLSINKKNKWGNTPLHLAVGNNNYKIAEILLKEGTKINIRNNEGLTALHYSSALGNLEITQLLLRYNALLLIEDNQARNALDIAKIFKNKEIIQLLNSQIK